MFSALDNFFRPTRSGTKFRTIVVTLSYMCTVGRSRGILKKKQLFKRLKYLFNLKKSFIFTINH